MATGLLEYSEDPLSDSTPTYTDVTSYLVGPVSWSDGKTRDLDEPQAGSMSFRLRNRNREWEPEFSGALFDAKPLRRFRWSVNGTAEGIWYAVSWRVTWPAGTPYSEVEVTCVDGFELLSLDLLDLLDPPTATSYPEVVMADEPFAFYRLVEAGGTLMVPETGPEGVFKKLAGGSITYGGSALVLGDESLSHVFAEAYGRAPLGDTNHFADNNEAVIEAITLNVSAVTDGFIAAGPFNSTAGINTFSLRYDNASETFIFQVALTNGTNPQVASDTHAAPGLDTLHVIGAWDGNELTVTVNGVLEGTTSAPGALREGSATEFLYVAAGESPIDANVSANLGHVSFYERMLNEDRRTAHYQAARERGFNPEIAGERIATIVTSALWAETEIQTGEHTVHAVMEHGQSKLDEIRAAVKAEMPDSQFYFNGDGDPIYLGWNYKDGMAPAATFGTGVGEHRYQSLEPVYDDEIFNVVTVGHESGPGEETQHTVEDTASSASYFRRAHAETGLILTEHHDAIAVATAILERHHEPMQRFASITINSANAGRLTQILTRQIGDLIRIKGLSESGTPIDVVTTILGRSKTLDTNGHMVCTWNCARGFNAEAGVWQLGIDGFSELNQTAVLA